MKSGKHGKEVAMKTALEAAAVRRKCARIWA